MLLKGLALCLAFWSGAIVNYELNEHRRRWALSLGGVVGLIAVVLTFL